MSNYPPNNPYSSPMAAGNVAGVKPVPTGNPRTVMIWQMVYIVLMVLLYGAMFVGAIFVFLNASTLSDSEMSAGELRGMSLVFGLLGGALALVYAVGLFWRRGNGGWIYHIVLISIGLTSCATWPLTIPLLIGWIKHRDSFVGTK